MKVALLKLSAAMIGAALLAGCAGVRAHKGAVVDPQLSLSSAPRTGRLTANSFYDF